MKYKVLRTSILSKNYKLMDYNTWVYQIVDTKEEAEELDKKWKQLGYYTKIKEVKEE